MILSIIVISHNQKALLKRCLDSILAQDLPFEHEIIVSDDASTDGTWELAQEYEVNFPGVIKAFQCNSDDCKPANNSQRSGWNRCNAYKYAKGRYIAHIDGDDFFREGAEVYRKQVEALEKHPECSMAMSGVTVHYEGSHTAEDHPWEMDRPHDGYILSANELIERKIFIINQAFMMRRNESVDPVALYGKRYVDSIITFHHMQFGSIIFVEGNDYMYVQQDKSVTGDMFTTRDTMVLWCLGLYIPSVIPFWSHALIVADYQAIRDVVSLARQDYQLQDKNKKSLEGLGVYIYDCFNRPHTIVDKCRLFLTTQYMRLMHACGWKSETATNILHTLLCKE